MIFKYWHPLMYRRLFIANYSIRCNIHCTLNIRNVTRRHWPFQRRYTMCTSVEQLPQRTEHNPSAINNLQISCHQPLLINSIRNFSSEDDSYIDFENVDDFEDKLASNYKDLLYPNSEDVITNTLKEVTNVQQVFDIIRENFQVFNAENCGQAVLALWELQKQCRRTSDMYSEVYLFNSDLFKSYVNMLKSHETFSDLLDLINRHSNEMSPDALSCSVLYFTRMNLDLKHSVIQNLVLKIENMLDHTRPGEFPATALSRFILSLGSYNRYSVDLYNKLSLVKTIPHVKYWLDNCHSPSDYKIVTISLHALSSIMTSSLLNDYHNVTVSMIDSKKIDECIENNLSAIIKAVSVLTFYDYNNRFEIKSLHDTVVKLMTLLIGHVDKLVYFQQFFRLQKSFLLTLEPAPLENELKRCCSRWAEKSDLNENELSDVSPELLYCLVMNTAPYRQHRFSEPAINLAKKTDSMHDLLVLSTGQLKPLLNLNKQLWPKLINKLNNSLPLRNWSNIHYISLRYLDHAIHYRDKDFEKEMVKLILSELDCSSMRLEPSRLAASAMFLLSYAEHIQNDKVVLTALVEQLLNCMHQFTVYDCLCISRGFKQILSRHSQVSRLFHLYAKLDAALSTKTMEVLDGHQAHLPLHVLNMLLRSFIYRNGTVDSHLFQKLVERFKHVKEEEISSRTLRNTVYNFSSTNCLVPELLDKFCDYIVKNKDIVLGSTVCKLLYSIFYLGHNPQNESFFKTASDVLLRDIENMSGFVLIQGALALSFYSGLSDPVIRHIFSIEFLDQLDSEIKHGYSKFAFPVRVKRCLMELNRSVCLDYLECNVPWFHAKFCQQESTSSSQLPTPFSQDFYDMLIRIVKDNKLIQRNVKSLYGHNIEFQLCVSDKGDLVQFNKESDRCSKLAIILHKDQDFTSGERRLKGPLQMEQRHLEILGYNVIPIDKALWNSMFMAEPEAKQNYVKNLIKRYINNSSSNKLTKIV